MAAKSALTVAVAHGDGIGPEIMGAALQVFKAARVPLTFKPVEMGKQIYLNGHSTGMTPEARKTVEELGILYKGPMETPKGSGVKSINVTARKVWNTFANKRIFQTMPGIDTVFSRAKIPIDISMIRENIEDTYGGIEHMQSNDVAQCRRLITRAGSEQVHRYAFESAIRKGAKSVTCVHKANIMKITDGLFLETFYNVAKEYPQIQAKDLIVDDLAMKLVQTPEKFDFMVLPNLQGDIISDLCAGLVGGLGMAPSANIGDNICIFEAVHGSAPDIAGRGIANPSALILSGIMMLRHIGLVEHAAGIQEAMLEALRKGERTADLCRNDPTATPLSTAQYAAAISKYLPKELTAPSVAVNWTKPEYLHVPPKKPEQHMMHLRSNRDRSKEITVGMDVFVDTHLRPPQLADFVVRSLGVQAAGNKSDGLTLTMLSNRGTQVYPTSSMFTECVNHYRVRIESPTGVAQTQAELLKLAAKLTQAGEQVAKDSEKVRVCSLEMLLQIDGKKGFTLAQGQ